MKNNNLISMEMPTTFGLFRLWVWEGERGREPVAISTMALDPSKEVTVRIHSECLTGDAFGSLTCDCGPQKDLALKRIHESGNGIFIYHRQEGRNIGLFNKVHAYNLMKTGLDTHEANVALAGQPDSREYSEALEVLDVLLKGNSPAIRLLTNNPYKSLILERHGYKTIAEPLMVEGNIYNEAYTRAKAKKFLHGSVGYGPYVGAELSVADVASRGEEVAKLLREISPGHGRKIFIGVDLSKKETDEASYQKLIGPFGEKLSAIPSVSLLFHADYPTKRSAQRELFRFLNSLTFPYSLQFRLGHEVPAGYKVDIEFINSLHPKHAVFQLRSDHWYFLDQESFVEYFSSPNHFVLVDDSWGRGVPTDTIAIQNKLLKLLGRGLNRIAIAGGYSADTVQRVFELEDYYKIPISVDAYSGLRSDGVIDLRKLSDYLRFFFPK